MIYPKQIFMISHDDDDAISVLQQKASLLNLFYIWASTFNPCGSLSSTDEFYTKTDKEKLQKVKVRTTHSTIKNPDRLHSN